MACVPDRDGAVREVAQVYERIKIQQPSMATQLAHNLLNEALRALNVALSVIKQQAALAGGGPVTPRSVKAEPQLLSPRGRLISPATSAASESIARTAARRGKRRRSSSVMERQTSSRVGLTTVPYEDGFVWRKYGEKKINGTSYTRSYFRCTYKDDTGCLATKHIQQTDNSEPPMFQVTYNNDHTCNRCTTTTAAANNSGGSNNLALLLGCCNSSEGVTISSRNGHAAMKNIKQEPPFNRTPPCQQAEPLFPIGMQQFCSTTRDCHGDILSTTSSCISGESCDEYSAGDMAQMAAAEGPAGDDLLHDPEFFLLCDSFKVY